MEALRTYIKDKIGFVLFYNGMVIFLGIFFAFSIGDILSDFSSGSINYSETKLLLSLFYFPLICIFALVLSLKFIMVVIDYKKQELITETLKYKGSGYRESTSGYHGAYYTVYFFDSKKEFWMYNKNQIYFNFSSPETYKIEYYKYSKCIKSVERITYNNRNGITKKKKSKTQETVRPNLIENFKIFIDNYTDGFIVQSLMLLTIPFSIVLLDSFYQKGLSTGVFDMYYLAVCVFVLCYALLLRTIMKKILSFIFYKTKRTEIKKLTVIGLPRTKRFLFKDKLHEYFLRTYDSDGKMRIIRYYSTDFLGLGDSSERQGYMGYGNFIGTEYEVEYYKLSHIVKSMKLLSQPEQSVISDDSVSYD